MHIVQQCGKQIQFGFRPEIPGFFLGRGVVDDGRRDNWDQAFVIVGFANAVPAVGVFHLKQVEHTDFISHISEITGGAFIQLGFWIGKYHALSALDALEDHRTHKAPAFARARCADHQHIPGKTAFAA